MDFKQIKDKAKEIWDERQYRYTIIGIIILVAVAIAQFCIK